MLELVLTEIDPNDRKIQFKLILKLVDWSRHASFCKLILKVQLAYGFDKSTNHQSSACKYCTNECL